MTTKATDWPNTVAKFLNGKAKTKTIKCTSEGVAQVTRVRLLKTFGPFGLKATTKKASLVLSK